MLLISLLLFVVLFLFLFVLICFDFFFFGFFSQAEDGIRDLTVTGVQTCALPISLPRSAPIAPTNGAKTLPTIARQTRRSINTAGPTRERELCDCPLAKRCVQPSRIIKTSTPPKKRSRCASINFRPPRRHRKRRRRRRTSTNNTCSRETASCNHERHDFN